MAYDATKDKKIEDLGQIEGTNLWGEIRQYGGGEQRVAIIRRVEKKDGTTLDRQLFRVSLQESCLIGEFLTEVAAQYGDGSDEEDATS